MAKHTITQMFRLVGIVKWWRIQYSTNYVATNKTLHQTKKSHQIYANFFWPLILGEIIFKAEAPIASPQTSPHVFGRRGQRWLWTKHRHRLLTIKYLLKLIQFLKKYIYKMVFFRPEKISTLNFSPECKSHITSLVGGGVVGEVIGEVVGEVRAWLLRNWEMEMTPGKLRNRNEWFLRKKKSGPEKGKDNFFLLQVYHYYYIYLYYIHTYVSGIMRDYLGLIFRDGRTRKSDSLETFFSWSKDTPS